MDSCINNEGTKVQNPRRLCHRIIASIHIEILICIRGQMRECTGKYLSVIKVKRILI